MRDAQHPFQHNGELVELWSLSRLDPALRTAHVRHAHASRLRIHAADVLVNELRLIPRGLNRGWVRDECWHESRGEASLKHFYPTSPAPRHRSLVASS